MNASDKTVAVLNFFFWQANLYLLEDFFHTLFNKKMFVVSEFFTHSF